MEERCLICGAIIPEGRQICPNCEQRSAEQETGAKGELDFSAWIREELSKRNMPQAELAKLARVAKPTISHYVRGSRSPSILMVNDILNVLGMRLMIVKKEGGRT